MPQYTIRPTSTIQFNVTSILNPLSQATILTNLGDNSDATTVSFTGGGNNLYTFGLASPGTIPSTEVLANVLGYIRMKSDTTAYGATGAFWITRSTDAVPTTGPTATTGSAISTYTNVTAGQTPVTWTNAQATSLYGTWYAKALTSNTSVTIADVWAQIQTFKLFDVAGNNSTSTSSYPALTVGNGSTVDMAWETSADFVNAFPWYSTVLLESRIELGGTTAGSGTLVARQIWSYKINSNANWSSPMTSRTAIANGTYRVYYRAHRLRSATAVSSDGYANVDAALATVAAGDSGPWSTGNTLTVNATAPLALTINSVTALPNYQGIEIVVTLPAAGGFTSPLIYVERDPAGVYLPGTIIRAANGVAGTFSGTATFYDFEATRGQPTTYRAYYTAVNGSGIRIQSVTTNSGSVQLDVVGWNLKDITSGPFGFNDYKDIRIVGNPSEELTEDLGVFRPLDRRLPVVVSGTLGGWDGELTIVTTTSDEWRIVKNLIESQRVLYLESPFGWAKYIRLIGGAKIATKGTSTSPRRSVTVAYVETAKP